MSLTHTIERISAKGVEVHLRGGKLLSRGPETSLDEGTVQELRRLKARLLETFAGRGDGKVFPLTQGQKTQWLLHLMNPADPSYNIGLALRFSRRLSRRSFGEALDAVSQRHELARTVVGHVEGEPLLHAGEAHPTLLEEDLGRISEAALADVLRRAHERPFDLEKGPLFRAALYDLPDGGCVFQVAAHHLICDGESVPIFLEDLFLSYFSLAEGRPISLPAPGKDYADFSRWQASYLASSDSEYAWSYWKQELVEAPGHPRWPGQSVKKLGNLSGGVLRSRLEQSDCGRFHDFCRSNRITPFCLLLSTFQAVLYRVLRQTDIWIGCPVSGRSSPGFLRTIGYFVNILPLPFGPRPGGAFLEILRQNQEKITRALNHRDYPYSLLVRKLGLSGTGKGTGPVRILINYQNAGYGTEAVELAEKIPSLSGKYSGSWMMKSVPFPDQQGQFDLAWSIIDNAEGIHWDLRHRIEAVSYSLAAHLHECLRLALSQIQDRIGATIEDLVLPEWVSP